MNDKKFIFNGIAILALLALLSLGVSAARSWIARPQAPDAAGWWNSPAYDATAAREAAIVTQGEVDAALRASAPAVDPALWWYTPTHFSVFMREAAIVTQSEVDAAQRASAPAVDAADRRNSPAYDATAAREAAIVTQSEVENMGQPGNNLVEVVRNATGSYKNVDEAIAAGYGPFLGCVSGPQGGAMGVHYPNGNLVGDGALDPMQPEVLIYEVRNGRYILVGVEFLVLYDDWHAHHDTPPVLMGQVFNYSSSPNRYGMPAFYELHVWAWKRNPSGVFADWNPEISCEGYNPNAASD